MLVDPAIVRLEILKVLLPMASRHGISDPDEIVKTATRLSEFVLESPQPVGESPDSTNKRTLKLPRKEKPADATPDFLTPPMVDKSNQAPG